MTIGASNSVNYSESGSSEDSSNVIQDNVFEAVLRKTYRVYRTFCGTYMSNLESNSSETGLQLLKEKLKNFYNKVCRRFYRSCFCQVYL